MMPATSIRTESHADHLRRGALWQFVSLVFQPPSPSTVARLRELHAELSPAEREATDSLMAALDPLEDLEDAYHRLLGSAGVCPACESAYQGAGVADRGNILADVAGFYTAFAFAPPASAETPGHIANELAFLAFLELKLAYFATRREHEAYATCRQAVESFLTEHLLFWLEAFCERLADKAGATHYGACAGLLHDWAVRSAEAVLPEMPASPSHRSAYRAEDEGETMGCEGCPR